MRTLLVLLGIFAIVGCSQELRVPEDVYIDVEYRLVSFSEAPQFLHGSWKGGTYLEYKEDEDGNGVYVTYEDEYFVFETWGEIREIENQTDTIEAYGAATLTTYGDNGEVTEEIYCIYSLIQYPEQQQFGGTSFTIFLYPCSADLEITGEVIVRYAQLVDRSYDDDILYLWTTNERQTAIEDRYYYYRQE